MNPGSLDALFAEWVRLQAQMSALHQLPDSDANDAGRQAIADRQSAIELAIYRTPARNVRDMALKLQFMVRDSDAFLPDDLRVEDAYAVPHSDGTSRLGIAIAGLWADAERLSAPEPD